SRCPTDLRPASSVARLTRLATERESQPHSPRRLSTGPHNFTIQKNISALLRLRASALKIRPQLTATDEVDNLDDIGIAELRRGVERSRDDLAIAFHGDGSVGEAEELDERPNGRARGDRVRLTVDGHVQACVVAHRAHHSSQALRKRRACAK